MKTIFVSILLLGVPLVWAQGDLEDAGEGNKRVEKYLVSQGASNKALLMRVFAAVQKLEAQKHAGGSRTLEVRQRMSSTSFVVNAGGNTDYWLIPLEPQDWDNRDRIKVDAEFTGKTKTFRDESGQDVTFRVMKQVKSKPAPEFTKEEFVRRLKDDETWTLVDFEQRKCKTCGGDGMIERPQEFTECGECHDGKISVDYLVSWW